MNALLELDLAHAHRDETERRIVLAHRDPRDFIHPHQHIPAKKEAVVVHVARHYQLVCSHRAVSHPGASGAYGSWFEVVDSCCESVANSLLPGIMSDGIIRVKLVNSWWIKCLSLCAPYDDSPAARGLRAGTTVLTQRGMGPAEMEMVADLWKALATDMDNPETVRKMRGRVLDLAARFPLPSD